MAATTKVVKTKLFIGNLDQETQTEELTELFSAYGPVLEASVIKDYGFVHFGSIEEAEKAVLGLNNKEFRGKRLRVELSTSTVRHRPGQPEPASALRHSSRARNTPTGIGNGNGVPRYGSSAPSGGGGPMRHVPSTWARQEAGPYGHIPRDPVGMPVGYGSGSSPYDRSRPYDMRPDPRQFYGDERDNAYAPEYDAPHPGDHEQRMYSARHYRDLPPHGRPDSMNYGSERPYERHPGMSPADPYYDSRLPPGPSFSTDPYRQYDLAPEYHANRSRKPEYPGSAGPNPPSSRDYDPYANYRPDPYRAADSQAAYRHESPGAPPHQQGTYPPSHRQQPSYTSGSSASKAYPPSHLSQYYGAQQRA